MQVDYGMEFTHGITREQHIMICQRQPNSSLFAVTPARNNFTLRLSSFALCCPKTLVCFAYLLERQCYFNKFYNIDTTNKYTFFIKPHTLLTPLAEAIGLYKIIWQTLYAVRHSLFPLYTLDIILNTLYLHSYCFQSLQKVAKCQMIANFTFSY